MYSPFSVRTSTRLRVLLVLLTTLLLPSYSTTSMAAAPADASTTGSDNGNADLPAIDPENSGELAWDSLIPEDYRPEKLLGDLNIDNLSDDDPRAAEAMQKLQALWDEAPVRQELDGTTIRLPGFVVPVETTEKETTGFLLVPYYGACIHVPPPPANQTVYVVTQAGQGTKPELFDVVWVTGTMSVKRVENDVAEAGYTLYASKVEPYE